MKIAQLTRYKLRCCCQGQHEETTAAKLDNRWTDKPPKRGKITVLAQSHVTVRPSDDYDTEGQSCDG